MAAHKMTIYKKIIFVNSFKGGAGKTSFSLANCINALFHNKIYDNVIYLDLDILGTATGYLFKEEYFSEEKCFDKTGKTVRVELTLDPKKESEYLHIGYLSPRLKNRSMYGEPSFIHHQELEKEILFNRAIDFIQGRMRQELSTLIVVDCAPGFPELEQKILRKCHEIAQDKEVDLEEKYLVTLDDMHAKKCFQCLRDSQNYVDYGNRTMTLIINDMQNYYGYLKDRGEDAGERFNTIIEKMESEIRDLGMNFRLWKYSQDIAVHSVYTQRSSIENNLNDYLFTRDNYMEWEKGSGLK